MPLYRITAPNGQTYEIEGPPGASDADVAQAVMAQYPDASAAAPKKSTIGSELKRGAQQVASGMQTAYGALTGSPEEAARAGIERGQAISQVAGEGVGLEPVKKAYEEKGLLSAAGEAISQIPRALAGQGANLATMAGGARLGAMAGSAIAPGVGTVVGGALGAGAAMLPQFFGSNVERQAAEQMEKGQPIKIDRTKAGVAAAGQAALEGAGTAFTLGKGVVKGVLGIADDAAITSAKAAQQLEATARRSLTGTVARGAGRGVAGEMPVEIAQQVIERAQAGLDLTSPDALKEYGEAAYQAGLVGGPLGGAGSMVNRGQARTAVAERDARSAAKAQAEREAAEQAAAEAKATAEPKLPMVTAPGAQGEMFTKEEMGAAPAGEPKLKTIKPVDLKPLTPVEPAQLDLGLDYQRAPADLVLEAERLKQQPETPETKQRLQELKGQIREYNQNDIESLRAEQERKAQEAKQDAEARKRFPGLAGDLQPEAAAPAAPVTPPAEVRPGALTLQNLQDTGVTMGPGVKAWATENVVGKTKAEVQALVDKDPSMTEGNSQRAKLLREVLAPEAAPFKEAPSVEPTPAPTTAVEQPTEPGTSEPSVGVPSEPAGTKRPTLKLRTPRTAAAPVTPDGSGLVPAGQPAVQGTAPEVAEPAPVAEKARKVSKEEMTVPEVPNPPSVQRLENAKTRAEFESALDDLVRIQRSEDHPDKDAVGEFLGSNIRFGQFEKALRAAEDRLREKPKAPAPLPATEPVTPKAKKPVVPRKPDAFYEPVGISRKTGKVLRGPQMMTQPMDDAKARVYLEETARADEGEGEDISDFFAELDAEIEAEETNAGGKQMELDFTAEPEPEAEAKPAPKAKAKAATRAKVYEPVGVTATGRMRRGPQAMLFPMTKEEEKAYATRAKPAAEEETGAPTQDERQEALDFTAAPDQEGVAAATTWSAKHGIGAQQVVYEDAEVALVRSVNQYGAVNYFPMNRQGDQAFYTLTAKNQPSWITAEQAQRLKDAQVEAEKREAELHAANPDGPFAGGENVVAADSIDPAVAKYAANLMRSLGLGDVKVFIYATEDAARPDTVDAHRLYGPFARPAQFKDKDLNGSSAPFGTEPGTYAVYLKSGMSENKTLEILAHELGHIIEETAYDNADAETRKAITNEYLAWKKQAKGATSQDFVQMLRNREDAELNVEALKKAGRADMPAAKTLRDFDGYWLSFGEWFADNVSRWATTNEKPLSIADKFFSKLAQKLRDLVALATGRKYPPAKSVADYLNKMGPADFRPFDPTASTTTAAPVKEQFSVSVSAESLIDSMGPLEAEEKPLIKRVVAGFKAGSSPAEPRYATKFRTQTADAAATIEHRLRERFDGAVRDSLGKLNPMGLYRQAQDHAKLLLEYFQQGSLVKDKTTGLWRVDTAKGVRPPAEVYALIDKWGEKNGYSRERATQIASRVLEGVRLDAMRASNKNDGTDFALHLKDSEIDMLVREYKADPDLQAMSKLMDEARIAMVDNMVKVGRLTEETGKVWREAVGYVPFDRLEDEEFAAAFSKVKKISNKGLAQVGKLPELVGSFERPVGNVFDNYLNTLGWMVGQTMKTDATVQTLRALEDMQHAKYLGPNKLGKPNAVGMYVKGEMVYWDLPSKYDVLAFKDLNPPKAHWLRILGEFSNVLRKSVTVLPPFALKQVTDDVQRAILTSGVKSPSALLRMSLANFGKLALAELRGIQHPMVREFGALGLTGEYDFQAGKPATSLLKDLGYKPRGKFEAIMHRLDGITRASDLAVRKAIYEQTLTETNDQLLAQTRAREFINFRRRGASDFVGAMVSVIPFFNAYIQGMDVLYRAASGKDSSSSVDRAQARRLFWSRASTVMVLASLYAVGKDDDDEDYKEMDLRTRDGNWILPGGYKIPVPGELGALFKVIPERVVEYMKRQGTPEEQDAWEATRTALSYIYEQYVGRATPVPQAIKPLIEAWSNKSFLTGRPLEGFHHQQMEPSMRRTEQTSELAMAIADFSRDTIGVQVSPIMVDNALRGYFGSTAALLTATTDSLLNPTRVDRPLHKWALLSNYLYDPVGTRRMTEFYEEREKVGRAGATLRELMKTDMDRAVTYAEAHADELMLEKSVNATLQQLEDTRAYRKYLNSPDGAKEMAADEREAQLKELKQIEVQYVSWLREAKAMMRQ